MMPPNAPLPAPLPGSDGDAATKATKATTERPDEPGFRPDIEGLRGIAVLLVLLFHAGVPVPGGFIGVDVFFVISGFLITGLLLREQERVGRVSLSRFYARRIRRLLPAAAVVVLATLGAAFALLGPLDRPGAMADGAAAALSVTNIRSALAEGDYFAAISGPSPFVQFWSLSVEEQFYLVWPALLFLVARGRRRWVGVVLAVVLAGSFAANVAITGWSTSWAFYLLPTRAWQLATGGLLAVAGMSLSRLPRGLAALIGWAGLAGIAAAAMLISSELPYPGLVALAPTLAAAALIVGGPVPGGPGAVLTAAPIRFAGRISYSLYLWHWPILVLVPLAAGGAVPLQGRLILAVVAVGVAWVSWRFVEEPFRRGRISIALGTRRAIAMGFTSIALVVTVALGLQARGARLIDEIAAGPAPVAARSTTPAPASAGSPAPSARQPAPATRAPIAGGQPPSSPSPIGLPAPSGTPAPSPTPAPLPRWQEIPTVQPAIPIPLPAGVRPSLANARTDTDQLVHDHCATQVPDVTVADCVYGNRTGAFTVALIGDSHAMAWFPAIEAVALDRGWRLVPYVKLSCPFIDARVDHFTLKREYTECATWREAMLAVVAQRPPDLTIVAMSHRGIFPTLPADRGVHVEAAAIARAMTRLPGKVVIMVDTPRTDEDIPGCVAANPLDVRPCAIPRSTGFTSLFGAREAEAATLTGAGLIDIIPSVCPAMPCQVVRDGMILYRDNHHLTATFSRSLAGILATALAPYVPARATAALPPATTGPLDAVAALAFPYAITRPRVRPRSGARPSSSRGRRRSIPGARRPGRPASRTGRR